MAKKLNKVFLNPTAEQIAEYGLIEGVSWFTEMDAIAAAIEDDQKKKAPERTYSLNNFQIVDGAHQITANLSKIAKQTGFTLSNDLSKVIDWAKTEIDYDVDHVTDHRVASATAEGKAELSDFQRVSESQEIKRSPYGATTEGQKNYEAAVKLAKDGYAVSPVDGSIIGYKDLSLTNVGSKATAVEEGETFADKKTTVSKYSTFNVKGGDFSFDYQEDTVKDVDKKDPFLVTESGKLTAKASAAASGTLDVTDSVIGSIGSSLSENSNEIKSLHKNGTVTRLVNNLNANAGSYETVTIDNSTVQGTIKGGKVSIENTATFKNETFLDKPEESGLYYNAVSTETNLGPTSNNKKLYVETANVSALTASEVESLQKEGLTVTEDSGKENIEVNKYEVVSYDIEGKAYPSGNFVYLSTTEYNNLSAASKKVLHNATNAVANVGWVDYTSDRVVTDANYLDFNKAPTGTAAANKAANQVNKYVYTNAGGTVSVTYYLTAEELGDKATPGTIAKAIDDALYTVQTEAVEDGSFRRVAEAGTVNAGNYEALAKDAYSTISTSYKNYTVTASISDDEAMELNKASIPNGFAWVKGAATTDKALFCMSQFVKSGTGGTATSTEVKYYLTAGEMSAMGFFGKDGGGKNIVKTYAEVKDTADPSFIKLDGWAFTDNAVGADRVYTNAEDETMYREGAAATTATLSNYTIDKTDVVTATVPYAYQRYELSYTTLANAVNKYTFTDGVANVTYYLTAEELGDGTAGTIAKAITDAGYVDPVPGQTVVNGGFLRVAPVGTVDADNYTEKAVSAYTTLKGAAGNDQFTALVANDLVGENAEYVTVIDGKAVDMYQIYGYGMKVTDPATVTADKITMNGSEIEYDAVVQEALWEGDVKVTEGQATLVDGIKTQNTKRYFDQYVKVGGEYVSATPAEEKSGEKVHEFITVAEKRNRDNNAGVLTAGEVVTGVQAKIWDGGEKKYVAAYINRTGALTNEEKSAANTAIKYYVKTVAGVQTAYALTDAEATAAAGADLIDSPATAVKFFVAESANAHGWYVDAQAAADIMTAGDKTKVAEVAQAGYRDKGVLVPAPNTDISAAAYTTLKQGGLLTGEYWLYDKAYVTEIYKTAPDDPGTTHNYDRVQIDGKDAFIEDVSGTLVTNAKTTYDAIYQYELYSDTLGASVDGLNYYMTKTELATVEPAGTKYPGYPADTKFKMVGTDPITNAGESLYRTSKTATDRNAYLTYDLSETVGHDWGLDPIKPTYTVDNAEAYYDIEYVVGKQVYKYTLSGDSATYYLTVDEAGTIGLTWGGALTKGDKVEGVYHYGEAANYDVEFKPNFTVATTVYYYKDSYSGWCISQDAEGKAVQAFNADGAIWSNVNGTPWGEDDEHKIYYSNYASELCDNTYNYNYDGDERWTAAQIEQLAASETAAGVATWKYSDKDGQVVWTRTSSIGEVSTYIMDHEDVVLENNEKSNFSKEATGSINIINGSEVKGTISGYLNVVVSDSKVANVQGGNDVRTTTETLSTAKGSVGKDGLKTITTKETEKTDRSTVGAGLFSVGRENADKVYVDAGNVSGFETVLVDGVNTGSLTVTNSLTATDTNTQTIYQGDADALRSDYVEDWEKLAFSKGIVSKVTAKTSKDKTTNWSAGSAEVTGRNYEFVPGTEQDTANTVGAISGYKTVTLTNANAGVISADDSTSESQTTYKLTTKNNVDTASATEKTKDENKAVAELTAKNTVTNPAYEADLTIGGISGFKTVELSNYSFGNANAVGDKTVTTSTSSVRDAVASDMRLLNAGVNKNTGVLDQPATQEYAYGDTHAANVGTHTYANNDMSYSNDTSTKRTASGTLVASGRAYEEVTVNYTEDEGAGKDKVYAYTQTATGRTVYLTEDQFDAIMSGSKADRKAQWTKDEKTTVYYRNFAPIGDFNGTVNGAQVVYKYMTTDESETYYLTEGEAANYNLWQTTAAKKLKDKTGDASLRVDNAAKLTFDSTTIDDVSTNSGNVGTVIVKEYSKAGEVNQFLTEAEATAGGWTKVDDDEFLRKANAGDDRSDASKINTFDRNLKVYENIYDSSLIIVLTEAEAKFIEDTSDTLADYKLSNTTGGRSTAVDAGLDVDNLAATQAPGVTAGYDTKIVTAHSYVLLNSTGQITDQKYVADAEYALLHAKDKVMENYVLDDGKHEPTATYAGTYNKALTQYQYRNSGFVVTADTTFVQLNNNTTAIDKTELYGWNLTDEEADAANVYVEVGIPPVKQKSEFVLSAVTEASNPGNTHFGNIYGYKEVGLSDMVGGNIYRVAEGVAIKADNETSKATYKKTISLGTGKNKGKTVYTETDSLKESSAWSADGGVTLIDSKVGNIAGYKDVEVMTEDGTVEVARISRTTASDLPVGKLSLDKTSHDHSTKVVTEDSVSTFKVTNTWQDKISQSAAAAGKVTLTGKRAGEDLVLDTSVVYKTPQEAVDAAEKAIAAHKNKQLADLQIKANGGVIGYQDVTVENATIVGNNVQFNGGKFTNAETENHTQVSITDNNSNTVTVTNKINDTTNWSYAASGSLTLTNVNYAAPNGYTPAFALIDYEGYTTVNEYVFNGVTYALTDKEQAALLEYGDLKKKTLDPATTYSNVRRKNDTITTPAVELTGTMQDVVNAKGVQASGLGGYAQDDVYYAAKAKEGDLYIKADRLNEVLDGTDPHPGYTEITVDTSKKFYGNGGGAYETKAAFEGGIQVVADVKKYVVTEDGKSTTYYLTEAEAAVMTLNGMDVKAASDTTAYTRMASVTAAGPAVTVNAGAINAADDAKADVFEFRGVVKNTGVSVSYYLTDAEAATLLVGDDYANFGKVGTTTYFRNPADIGGDLANATEAHTRTEVLSYWDGADALTTVYLTEAEFAKLAAIDDTYDGYVKKADTKYYRAAKSAYNIANSANLDAKFTAVNESAEVYEVTNNLTAETLGYLTRAEILALKTTDFDDNYTVNYGTTYLRAADDTTNIIKINAFKEGDGYVLAPGEDLSANLYNAVANQVVPAKATSKGFQNVMLTNADMGNLEGGNHTEKTSDKLAAKKNSTIATYTTTRDTSDIATGSLIATDSAIGDASWYDKVSLTASEMDEFKNSAGDIQGGKSTRSVKSVYISKLYENEAFYSTPARVIEYTQTTKESETASGSAELKNVVVAGDITGYKDVTVSFDKEIDDKAPEKNTIGDVLGGNTVTNETLTYANANDSSYSEAVTKETATAIGTVTLTNVVAGDVEGFMTANVTKSDVDSLVGGSIASTTTEINVGGGLASSVEEKVVTAAGKAVVDASTVGDGGIAQFKDVALTGGVEVGGDIIVGGDDVDELVRGVKKNTVCRAVTYEANTRCTQVDYNGGANTVYLTAAEFAVFQSVYGDAVDMGTDSYRTQAALSPAQLETVAAIATMKEFDTDAGVPNEKTVYLTDEELDVFDDVKVVTGWSLDDTYRTQAALTPEQLEDEYAAAAVMVTFDTWTADPLAFNSAKDNTACYAVFYNDGDKKVVYLTSAEYKVFATQETTAMIDTTVAVYRKQSALTDAELKDAVAATVTMKGFKAYTDDPVTYDEDKGQEGRNTTTWVVKTAGNSLTIDEDGAKVGGKVSGYATVVVSGNSSFAGGYFGTAKNDKLIVDASLATFTTVEAGKNPVGFDFGDGKDELVLNGTIGIQAAFKYDEATGTNAWNVETISGDGTIVCATEDVKDVKAAFDNIKVYGTENYDAETALEYQTFGEAKDVQATADINEWLGFCDSADFFENNTLADRTLTFTGDSVKSGDVIAQMTVDGGATYTTLKNGDTVKDGAVVRISFSSGSRNTVSSDYTIAFK